MHTTGKQRAENTPPEQQIANALGREVVDWLKHKSVLPHFARLVELHCDPHELWDGLTATALAWRMEDPKRNEIRVRAESKHAELEHDAVLFPRNTFDDEIGFDRSELKTVINRLRQCADDLERLRIHTVTRLIRDGSVFRQNRQVEVPSQPPVEQPTLVDRPTLVDCLSELPQLANWHGELVWRLRILARAVETAAQSISFGERPTYEAALTSLVAYVCCVTGRPCDAEISALVEAVRGTPYDTEAHRRWRERHSKLPPDTTGQ